MTAKSGRNSKEITENDRAYAKAVELLSLRMHSSAELSRKLLLRGFSKETITQAITKLEGLGFINDDNFAEVYMNNLIRNKTFGFYGIKAKLIQRGIASSVAERLLNENLDLDIEIKLAKKFLAGKHSLAGEDNKQKTAASLARRGFRSEVINKFRNSSA